MRSRIYLKNGRVLDPASGVDKQLDVEITDGRITALGKLEPTEGEVYDAEGCCVVPGLIDYHTHLFEGGSQFGFDADLVLPSGVTTAVDAGTAGTAAYEVLHRQLQNRRVRTFTFLNLSPMGQLGSGLNENLDPALVRPEEMRELVHRYPDEIRAVKVRISRSIVGALGSAPLFKAIETAQELGLPVVVHSTDPCIPMEELAQALRPGDVLCHVFHGKGSTILDENGRVKRQLWEAQERGVRMDAANGRNNFAFAVARAALEQGFKPDIISTDLTAATVQNGQMARNLPFLMSKYLAMGMTLTDAVERTTIAPAKALGLQDGSGTLAVGARADVAVLEVKQRPCRFMDAGGVTLDGSQMLANLLTIQDGRVVYNSNQLPCL